MELHKIGSRIVEARKKLGYTQLDLAVKLNVSDKTVSKWERGAGCPDISLLAPLSEVLHMSVDELISGSSPEDAKEPSKALLNLLNYSKEKMQEHKERIFCMLYIIATMVLGIGFGVCLLVDYVLHQEFTWSIITSVSIWYAWCMLFAVLKTKHKIRNLLITACLLVYPLLYAIAYVYFSYAWFIQLAFPIALSTTCYVAITALIWLRTRLYFWNKLALTFLLAPISTFISNALSGGYSFIYVVNLVSCITAAMICYIIGKQRAQGGMEHV